jgi:hypothetical protein
MHLMIIVSISSTGGHFPIRVIVKGRTERCEQRFRSHSEKAIKDGRMILTRDETGWRTQQIVRTYLHAVRLQMSGENLFLWGLFTTH